MLTNRILIVVAVVALTSAAAAAEGPRFKGITSLEDVVQTATGFSQDGQAATVLFDNLLTSVDRKGGPLVGTRTLTVVLPISSQSETMPVTLDIRGYTDTSEGTRAVVVVQAAGKTSIIDLQQAHQNAKGSEAGRTCESVRQAFERAKEQAKRFPPKVTPARQDDYFHRIEGKLAPGATLQATLWLLVERDSAVAEQSGLLTIDSLDVSLGTGN